MGVRNRVSQTSASQMFSLTKCLVTASLVVAAAPTVAADTADPLRFFEGRTESTGTVKVMFRKPARTHSIGTGRIEHDGSLTLVQQVDDEGKPPHERRWRIRQVGPGRFTGTMSDASGPVLIEKVGARYRFRFKLKGNLSVEQWIAPRADGMSADNSTTVHKLGMRVVTGNGIIRKIEGSARADSSVEKPRRFSAP